MGKLQGHEILAESTEFFSFFLNHSTISSSLIGRLCTWSLNQSDGFNLLARACQKEHSQVMNMVSDILPKTTDKILGGLVLHFIGNT